MGAYLDLDDVCNGHPRAKEELEHLRYMNGKLRGIVELERASTDAILKTNQRLKAEIESLRRDAERYRFLRDVDRSYALLPYGDLLCYADNSLDEAIDAAMLKGGKG